MHAQGIVETSHSAVRELQLILNWVQECFLENVENIPQKNIYIYIYIYDTVMTTFVNVIAVLNMVMVLCYV